MEQGEINFGNIVNLVLERKFDKFDNFIKFDKFVETWHLVYFNTELVQN